MMRVLVACEFSGVVRNAFEQLGHDAWSCDLLPTESPGTLDDWGVSTKHIRDDVLNHLDEGWDIMIAHPPCTFLASSGARWFDGRRQQQKCAVGFVKRLLRAPISKIALENPVGILSSEIRPPDQIIQPWWFGHGETKATCLWLKGLPPLLPTKFVKGRESRIHRCAPGPARWKERSRTYVGIAKAMSFQWGVL